MKDLRDPSNGAGRYATASSLLEQVRSANAEGWSRLSSLYGPLVQYWAQRSGVGSHDAADIVQEVFRVVHQRIHDFRRDRVGDSFRKWLKAITNNKVREHWRRLGREAVAQGGSTAQLQMNQLEEVTRASLDDGPGDDADEIGWLHRRAMELIRDEFAPTTWKAFWGVIVDGRAAADVAADLGISRNAVYIAKSRVLSRLRVEFADVLTENDEATEDSH